MVRYASVLVAVALLVLFAQPVLAADQAGQSHEGTVVKAGDGKLTMSTKDGKQHMHMVPADAKITLDGKPARLEDLREGFTVRVSLKDERTVTSIEAKSKK